MQRANNLGRGIVCSAEYTEKLFFRHFHASLQSLFVLFTSLSGS